MTHPYIGLGCACKGLFTPKLDAFSASQATTESLGLIQLLTTSANHAQEAALLRAIIMVSAKADGCMPDAWTGPDCSVRKHPNNPLVPGADLLPLLVAVAAAACVLGTGLVSLAGFLRLTSSSNGARQKIPRARAMHSLRVATL